MIICWDNLEKFNIHLSNRGNFRGSDGTYYYHESCLECGEPFLSKSKTDAQFCSYECMVKSEIYREKLGIEQNLLNEATDIVLSKDEILDLRSDYPKRYVKILKNKYPRTLEVIEEFFKTFLPQINSSLLSQKIFHYINNLKEIPKCPLCGNILPFNTLFHSWGYKEFCSLSCALNNPNLIRKYDPNYSKKNERNIKITKIMNDISIECYTLSRTNKIFLQFLKKYNYDFANVGVKLINKSPRLYKSLVNHYNNSTYKEIYYLIINDNPPRKICYICKEEYTPLSERGYRDYCIKCGNKHGRIVARFKKYPLIYNYCIDNEYKILSNRYDFALNSSKTVDVQCLRCKNIRPISIELINKGVECFCRVSGGTSKAENEIAKYLNIDHRRGNREILEGLEVDIFVPDKNIAIEYNGLYYHSEISGNKNRKYHITKTEMCEEKGIQLIHIFANEWKYKEDITKSALLSKLGVFKHRIFARKCIIKEISSNVAKDFLESNHLQGHCNSSIRYGLFFNDELVSCMTFGKRRITGKTELELLRFCNKLNTQVIGGASKLFKHFVRNIEFEEIISYADRRWSNGNLYENLGFELSHKSNPSYWYIENGKLIPRSVFMKHKLPKLLNEFDPELTEWGNMQLNGYDRIWDCGCLVYKFTK